MDIFFTLSCPQYEDNTVYPGDAAGIKQAGVVDGLESAPGADLSTQGAILA